MAKTNNNEVSVEVKQTSVSINIHFGYEYSYVNKRNGRKSAANSFGFSVHISKQDPEKDNRTLAEMVSSKEIQEEIKKRFEEYLKEIDIFSESNED